MQGGLLAWHDDGEQPERWLVRAGRCGGAAPAQGRAEGPDAQKSEEGVERMALVLANWLQIDRFSESGGVVLIFRLWTLGGLTPLQAQT